MIFSVSKATDANKMLLAVECGLLYQVQGFPRRTRTLTGCCAARDGQDGLRSARALAATTNTATAVPLCDFPSGGGLGTQGSQVRRADAALAWSTLATEVAPSILARLANWAVAATPTVGEHRC